MRTLTAVVDGLAAQVPHNVWVKAPLSTEGTQDEIDWQDITWLRLSRAVNTMASWMGRHLGEPTGNEPVAYMGVNDIRYPIVILASLKTGYKVMLTSPRNSIEGHLSLLRATACRKFLFSKELQTQVDHLGEKYDSLLAVQVPEVQQLLETKSDGEGYISRDGNGSTMNERETLMILHSSGTTGMPKPIHIKAGVIGSIETLTSMPVPEGRQNVNDELYGSPLMLTMTPFFHIFGINIFARSIYHQGTLVLLPPGKPPTAELLLHAITTTKPTAVVSAPSILEDICNLPGGLNTLSTVDSVFFGGAPLARSAGDKISKVTTLLNGIGSTEMFNAPNLIPADPADWEYFEWNPEAGIVMEPWPSNQRLNQKLPMAEMVVKRKQDDPKHEYQFVFHNFPELSEWRTRDLFEQHPVKPALWRYVGRADDIMVLSNGEKLHPVSFEQTVEEHPWVKGALMVGAGKFQTRLLIESHSEQTAFGREAFIDQVWPWVEKANAASPAHARVWRSMIALANPEKPFQRAPKGSVMRQATWQLYEKEIELLYVGDEASVDGGSVEEGLLETPDIGDVQNIIRKAVGSVLSIPPQDITDTTDLFSLGLDSLRVLELSQIMSRRFHHTHKKQSSRYNCSPRMIYENPTIKQLSKPLVGATSENLPRKTSISREEKMSAMIHRHTRLLQSQPASIPSGDVKHPRPEGGGRVAILTGSTGSLGSYLLHALISSPNIDLIYCLNRTTDAPERQEHSFVQRDLGSVTNHGKLKFLTADLTQPLFGLPEYDYIELQQTADVLIHNAWPVNFNSPLETFEPAITATRQCAEFAFSSGAHIVFVSSIASVLNYPAVRSFNSIDGNEEVAVIPEEFETDNSLPAHQGYGEAKHLASCVLAKAVQIKEGLKATIMRAGQLAGPVHGGGVWNKHEWLPSLIATSKEIGKIPISLGRQHDFIDWIPVDIAAMAIVDLTLSRLDGENQVAKDALACFHILNPQVASWSAVVDAVREFYAEGDMVDIRAVGFDEWMGDLVAVGERGDGTEVERYPALKLLDFFHGMGGKGSASGSLRFATEKAVASSPAMSEAPQVGGQLMRKWLEGWAF
ncbi:hypothetical protein B0H63DRAFT_545240 [Podospora didyma]|uniref:Carrier domain-containing protein n=1 Tax=Podospora didyma TaxID=330526 RepID=A0AAE0NGB1_9PEZI|nr:hypothetical protein B0H63DRAFT_545240 [Podospora didyma]